MKPHMLQFTLGNSLPEGKHWRQVRAEEFGFPSHALPSLKPFLSRFEAACLRAEHAQQTVSEHRADATQPNQDFQRLRRLRVKISSMCTGGDWQRQVQVALRRRSRNGRIRGQLQANTSHY